MTVRALPALVRYTGNGSETTFAWDWDMILDSTINVMVNNFNVFNWTLQGMTVVFNTAPDDGDEIIIYRRTKLWQPSNYRPFGRFHAEKTELEMDRSMLIAQERFGDTTDPLNPNGIVGGSNLSTTREEFTMTVVSERGTDAVLPMYNPDDNPDVDPPEPGEDVLVWGEGSDIVGGAYSIDSQGASATLTFKMDLTGGDPTFASVQYPNFNVLTYTNWCAEDPDDYDYWMRVTTVGVALPTSRYIVSDGTYPQALNTAFPIRGTLVYPDYVILDRDGNIISLDAAEGYVTPRDANIPTTTFGPYINVNTFGDTAPAVREGTFKIEVCKDNNGAPDGSWVSRNATLKAIYNTSAPPPVDTTGSTPWATFFGIPFGVTTQLYDATKIIPADGISLLFEIPITSAPVGVSFVSIENTAVSSTRTGSVGQTVGDYTSYPSYTWGTGGGIAGGINFDDPAVQIDLIPGQKYFFCIRNNTPSATQNYIRLRVYVSEQ
mgnify:CR=1 FL=1